MKQLRMRIQSLLKNKMIQDGILSIGAKCIFYFVVNFVIYSLMHRRMGGTKYGEFVVLLGYVQVFAFGCGEALNHVRVLHQETDGERAADYRLIAILECVVGLVIFGSGLLSGELNIAERFMYAGVAILMMLRLYTECVFRIQINYRRILLSSVVCSVGYIIGFALYVAGLSWCVIFLCGEGVAVLYAAIVGGAFKSEHKKSAAFKTTLKNIVTLTFSYLISYMLIYSDRFILEALIDSELAGEYFNATYYGKLVAIVIPPITSVLLSNISKGTIELNRKMVRKTVAFSGMAIGFFFLAGIPGARLMMGILFPGSYKEVLSFIDIANLSLIVYYSCSIINMLAIRLCPYSLQVWVEVIYSVCYLVAGLIGTYLYGALGFAIGSLIINALRFVMLWLPVERRVRLEGNGGNS
ncbi:MAG: hypothetical protein IJW18_05715 [Lachnospiraceae bacterium]|nr:hypothetical protein [Lachnospiraceae bacterium]